MTATRRHHRLRARPERFSVPHLAVPVEEVHDGFSLGRWLATQRTRAEALTDQRAAALTALDRWWNPPWPITWQRTYHAARQSLEHSGTGAEEQKWLEAQRARSDRLHPEEKCLLQELGLVDLPGSSASPAGEGQLPARERAFQRGLVAAQAFRAREGHLDVPQRHIEEVEGDPVRLGQWLSNLRRRRSGLSQSRLAELAELGL
ncbi:helicase associated domain-containing protein [Streptomyces sp. NPDC005571]|uniref:helicase associated domain-containing protein n=1 Tax=Streptomyces sp. NPDC005571 TaxID=3156888 RepID=UPI0033B633BD